MRSAQANYRYWGDLIGGLHLAINDSEGASQTFLDFSDHSATRVKVS
jgi:hypothetical protein